MLSANFGSYRFQITAMLTLAILLSQGNEVRGQIAPDNTVNTQVETDSNFYSITGGIESGKNLFHSFEQFSLLADEVVNFDSGLEIENIFSRVTGGSVSKIDGLIQTQGNVSLFLLNPAGIVFGANAQLDIGGSFIVSTADRLIFEDGTEFNAVTPEVESLLTISSPVGLQYGGGGAIEVLLNDNRASGSPGLSIDPGNTLALLGGDVSINRNSLNAIGSNTEIASIQSGKIELQTDDGWQFDYQNAERLGKIDFRDRTLINSGRVNLRGETIEFSAGSGILDFNQFGETNNSINLNATKSIEIDDGLLLTQMGQRSGLIDEAINGDGGDIIIEAPKVFISNGSVISAGTLSEGAGGSITINALDTLKLDAEEGKNPAIISTSTREDGLGGSIDINTGKLIIEDGSQVQALAGTDAMGKGGTITVNASQGINLSGSGILRSQNVAENGELDTSEQESASGFTASSGRADLAIDDEGQAQGESGSLTINTPKLAIDRSAQISVNSYGLADAGNIKIATSTLSLDTAGEIVANTASGEGGSINVLADKLIVLDRNSSISTTAAGQGNGGNIILKTANLVLLDFNRISANAIKGNGGNISIDTQGLFIDSNSSITASSEVETKQGNVEISTLDLSSRIVTDYRDRSFFIAEDGITSNCGAGIDLNSNRLRDVGRGGMPSNPLQETTYLETLNDWGKDSLIGQNDKSDDASRLHFVGGTLRDRQAAYSQVQPIIEVSGWIINSQGTVELVAHDTRPISSDCQINRSQAN